MVYNSPYQTAQIQHLKFEFVRSRRGWKKKVIEKISTNIIIKLLLLVIIIVIIIIINLVIPTYVIKCNFKIIILMNVQICLILFCIERGFHSRTELGEREINGSAVHNMSAVGNKILFGFCPSPLHNLKRGIIWTSTSLSPPSHITPPFPTCTCQTLVLEVSL
jgi:hypothetical protein